MDDQKRKRGRPSKLTPALTKEIAKVVARSVPFKYAAEFHGIPHPTAEEWLTRGRAGEEPYAAFARAISRAKSEALCMLTEKALEGGKGSSQATWLMERRYREEYTPLQRFEHSGPQGGAIPIEIDDVTKLSDEELARIAQLQQ